MIDFPLMTKYRIPWKLDVECLLPLVEEFSKVSKEIVERNIPRNDHWMRVKVLRLFWLGQVSDEDKAREIARSKNIPALYEWLNHVDDLPLSQIGVVHYRGMFGAEGSSSFREKDVALKINNESVDEGAPCSFISDILTEIQEWEKISMESPIISAIHLHLLIGSLHPFSDGNGRVARAYEYHRLKTLGLALGDDWNPELTTYWDPRGYTDAFLKSRSEGRAEPLIAFILRTYVDIGRGLFIS
jgi:hypothetical protein